MLTPIRWSKSWLFLMAFITFNLQAEITLYPFADAQQEARFNRLSQELRCPKCQNNNLADSNAPLANDLKDIIFEKIQAGETDRQIEDYLKARYGDFISYRPPVKPSTWFIWFGPFVLLGAGLLGILRFVRRKGSDQKDMTGQTQNLSELTSSQKTMIDDWQAELEKDKYPKNR